MQGNNKRSRFNEIVFGHLREVQKDIVLAACCIVGTTLTALVAPWPLKLIFDQLLLAKPLPDRLAGLRPLFDYGQLNALLVLCATIVGIALFKGFFAYYQLFLTSRIGYRLVYTLRGELFDHLQRLSLSFHHKARSGELLNKLTSDTNTLKDVYADSALTFSTHVLTLLGMFLIMFQLNVRLSVVILISFPLLTFVIYKIYLRVKLTARNQRHTEGRLASRVGEILSAVPLIQAYGTEAYERERFDRDSTRSMRESIRISRMEAAATRLVEIISALGTAIVVLFGCLQVFEGTMTPGDVLVFVSYITQIYQPVRQMARISTRYSRATASIERISEILAAEADIKDRPDAVVPAAIRGEIRFDRVTFGYRDDQTILDDISFHVRPGERVALVGASGAGKSTIANMTLRLFDPRQGSVSIDGIDLRRYQRTALRRQIAVVQQDAVLFGTSIKENIAYGRLDAAQEEIEEAARQVHAHEFIAELPDGYRTIVGESGGTLSGGQKQRISLARAFVRQASILILDEPTSAVDAESQALIRAAMDRLPKDKTILLIAHQFQTLLDFDRILVLKKGVIVEQGDHASLMARRGYYHELYRLQNGLRAA